MKPRMKYLALLLFILSATTTLTGQNPSEGRWNEHFTYLDVHYSVLPQEKLDSITLYLDSTVIGTQCYKIITNPENTKFIAFYLVDRNSPSFNAIKREYGGIYRSFTWGEKKEGAVEVFAYTVSGMFFHGIWYYYLNEYVEFYAASVSEAKKIFLLRSLWENGFFQGKKPKENKRFWNKNEFDTNTYPYKKEYPDMPEVVVKAGISNKTRQSYNLNKQTEQLACAVSTSLWYSLHRLDSTLYSTRYKSRYTDDHCLALYNSGRNIILLPVLFFDKADKAHVSYYVLKLSDSGTVLYKWKKFPDKEINREKGREALEVIYDIRNFISNWGWGTNNLISNNTFWNTNFTSADIEVSKCQYMQSDRKDMNW